MEKLAEEKVLFKATLCFPIRDGKVTFGRKTKKIGAGLWNGYGGGIEAGEDPRMAAVREFCEESRASVLPQDLEFAGIALFHNTKIDGSCFDCKVYVFLIRNWSGKIVATAEMIDPTEFDVNELPFSELMPADPFWIPRVLAGEKIFVEAWYGPFQKELLRLVEVSPLEGEVKF